MGVNAEALARVVALRADEAVEVESVDFADEWEIVEERVEDWAAVGEVRGLVDGRMDEASVEDDWQADWAVEEEDTKEGGRVEEECAEDWLIEGREDEEMTRGGRWGDRWLGEIFSVICVSSVLFGILLSSTSTVMVSCFFSWTSTTSFWDLATFGECICLL